MKETREFFVAGVSFEGRQTYMADLAQQFASDATPKPVRLVAEPDNQYDPNAIRIEAVTSAGWKQIGYVPREINTQIGPKLASVHNPRLVSVGRPGFNKPLGGKVALEVEIVV
jgi:hypothetical protein